METEGLPPFTTRAERRDSMHKHALQRQQAHKNCKKICALDPTIRHK